MTTIGEFTDVPEPGAPVASAWAQQATNQVVHRFANKAALDAWTTALVGTLAITYDDGLLWRRVNLAGASQRWARQTPQSFSVVGGANPGTVGITSYTVATLNIPADPGPRRFHYAFHALISYSASPGDLNVRLDGVTILSWRPPTTGSHMVSMVGHNVSLPGSTAGAGITSNTLTVVAAATSATPTTFADPFFNQLGVTITPA